MKKLLLSILMMTQLGIHAQQISFVNAFPNNEKEITRAEVLSQYLQRIKEFKKAETGILKSNIISSTHAEISPLFLGGEGKFHEMIETKMENSILTQGTYHAIVTMMIDENGEVSRVSVKGENIIYNSEIMLAIYETKNSWKPAKNNGKEIATIHQIPIVLHLD